MYPKTACFSKKELVQSLAMMNNISQNHEHPMINNMVVDYDG